MRPGTVRSKEYAEAMPTSWSPSSAPMSRPGSCVSRSGSSTSGGGVLPKACESSSMKASQSASPRVRTGQVGRSLLMGGAYQSRVRAGHRNGSVL